jgi:Uma2 family endonuclease
MSNPLYIDPLSYIDPENPYPDSDGRPMADNTLQFEWIVKIKENLEILFADRPDVFVAGDLLWYPVPDRQESAPLAPDVLVAFGRPKGYRGSYKQWEEGGIAPQVVFEVLSPSNSQKEMRNKRALYEDYGVEEFYIIDPDHNQLEVWLRQDGRLTAMPHIKGWTSPRLGIRFDLRGDGMQLFYPDGTPFRTPVELARHAEQETRRADQEAARADQEAARATRMAERLRALGIDPEAL